MIVAGAQRGGGARPSAPAPPGRCRAAAAAAAAAAADPPPPPRPRARRRQPPAPHPRPPPPAPRHGGLNCPHFDECSGCTLDGAALAAPPVAAEAAAFFAALGARDFAVAAGPPTGWRHRARLAVRASPRGGVAVGLFAAGTHDVVDIQSCSVHHPLVNAAAELVRRCAGACGTPPYDELSRGGGLRYLQLTVVEAAGDLAGRAKGGDLYEQVQLGLVWNATPRAAPPAALAALAGEAWRRSLGGAAAGGAPPLLHSVWANYNDAPGNAVAARGGWARLHGPAAAWARVGGAAVAAAPGAFLQANPAAMAAAVGEAARWVPPRAAVADLHAGVGTVSLLLLAAAAAPPRLLRLVEVDAAGEAPFWAALDRARAADAGGRLGGLAAEYHVAAAGADPGRWLAGVDVAFVDPPRGGLEPALLAHLCAPPRGGGSGGGGGGQEGPDALRRLIYLSCGFPALRRDLAALLGSGRWRLAAARGYVFFPGSDHLETLAVLDRV